MRGRPALADKNQKSRLKDMTMPSLSAAERFYQAALARLREKPSGANSAALGLFRVDLLRRVWRILLQGAWWTRGSRSPGLGADGEGRYGVLL